MLGQDWQNLSDRYGINIGQHPKTAFPLKIAVQLQMFKSLPNLQVWRFPTIRVPLNHGHAKDIILDLRQHRGSPALSFRGSIVVALFFLRLLRCEC